MQYVIGAHVIDLDHMIESTGKKTAGIRVEGQSGDRLLVIRDGP